MKNCLKPIYLFAWTVIIETRNSRTIIAISLIYLLSFSIALFVGEISITESQQAQAGFSAAFLRLATLFFLSLFTINSIVRDINDRMLLLYLSLPISRTSFVLGKFVGFSTIAAILAIFATLMVYIFSPLYISLTWGLSLLLESLIIICFSLLCAFSFAQVTSAFSSVAIIYILSRSLSAIILMAKNPFKINDNSASQQFSETLITLLDHLLPRLDKFTQTDWLIYQTIPPQDLQFILIQTAIYLLLLLSISFIDLFRKSL